MEEELEACHLSHKWACEYQDLLAEPPSLLVFGTFPGGQLTATTLGEDPMMTKITPIMRNKAMVLTISTHVLPYS
jgi:hypothetical protein